MEIITKKWFAGDHPVNAVKANTSIGSGTNGKIDIVVDSYGVEGNDYTIQVVVASAASANLSAVLNGKDILVTLATDSSKNADDTKNTAKLIAGAIDKLVGISATASGTGATAISAAVSKKSFTGGLYATEAPIVGTVFATDSKVYFNTKPVDKFGNGWKSVTLDS